MWARNHYSRAIVTKKLILPSLKDPRVLFLAIFTLFIYHIVSTPAFARDLYQLGAILISCFFIDLCFKYLRSENIFPFSALVSSMGIFVIIDTKFLWVYVLAAFLTIGSKHFLRLKGHHIFNPNNFAVVMIGLFLPTLMSPDGGSRWGGDLNWSLIVSALGLVLAYRAQRFVVAATFILAFLALAYFRAQLQGLHMLLTMSILFSPGLLVFTYFMITDPRTSPNNHWAQAFFAIAVAVIDQGLRFFETRMSVFISLFVVTALYSLVDLYFQDKLKFDSWRYLQQKRAFNE